MATFKDGINGGFNGRIGSVVGYKWRSKWVMRSLPKASKKKRSMKQLLNEEKMRTIQLFLSKSISLIRKGFSLVPEIERMSAFNAAMSYNKKHGFIIENDVLKLNFENLMFAQGDLENPKNLQVKQVDSAIEITWDFSGDWERGTDQSMILLIDDTLDHAIGTASGALRKTKKEVLSLGGVPPGTTLHIYTAFIADDRRSVSNSVYGGYIKVKQAVL